MRIEDDMLEDPEHLLRQRELVDAVVVEEPSLSAPANVESAGYIGTAPVHYANKFIPIVDLRERHLFDGSASDDEAVILTIADIIESQIERAEMLGSCILGYMAGNHEKVDIDLKRGVAEDPEELRLSGDFIRHQIEDGDAERAYVLRDGTRLTHKENALLLEDLPSGEAVWDTYWHLCKKIIQIQK